MKHWCIFIAAVLLMTGCSRRGEKLNPREWQVYRANFVSADGRIIDLEQEAVSHSEGQGYGLMLACAYRDRRSFDKIWAWTGKNLQVRKDGLFAWRWRTSKSGGGVDDLNNASDGEILIAWALYRAGRQWNEPQYTLASRQICGRIRRSLVRDSAIGRVLLPGAVGFEKPDGLVLNLSYWIFPAFKDLAACDPAPEWELLHQSGLRLANEGRFGVYGLPPEWLKVSSTIGIASGEPPVYGYNAVRIPLHLVWAGEDRSDLLKPYLDYWASFQSRTSIAATINLVDGQQSVERISSGVQAVIQLTQAVASQTMLSQKDLPVLSAKESYFSASLLLLTKVALQERVQP